MARKHIPTNIARKLWAQCGGFCQNPNCNKYLFAEVENNSVSLANVAHIIGHGTNGPRSGHELANNIDRDGINNLIMLCLECHKAVDEFERQFSVEEMKSWKNSHQLKVDSLFNYPQIYDERIILEEINDLLIENKMIFDEYGPFSSRALDRSSGDAILIWRRRCLDTILPNNERIIGLIEANKRNFSYPWEVYRQMMGYRVHANSFRDNCLLEKKVNDYKLFPREFDVYIKKKIGLSVEDIEYRKEEEIEFRCATVSIYIEKFLANHSFIDRMEKLNIYMFDVELKDGRSLRVFTTNTYFFTEYTFDKIMAIDPAIDAIICSSPMARYTCDAKALCIENKIGLFNLGEFMGAIHKDGDDFLNYIPREEQRRRINGLRSCSEKASIPFGFELYVFGSYIRRELYRDIDLIFVYPMGATKELIISTIKSIERELPWNSSMLDVIVFSEVEYKKIELNYDNRIKIA